MDFETELDNLTGQTVALVDTLNGKTAIGKLAPADGPQWWAVLWLHNGGIRAAFKASEITAITETQIFVLFYS